MALRKTFQSCNATIFRPAKQAHKAVTIPRMDLRTLYHFLLTSVECYEIAIEAFTERKNKFLRAAVTRDDETLVDMLKQDASLFSACYPVKDYSLRQFVIPAFVYYLFTWDKAGLEIMLSAISKGRSNQEEALAVVGVLSAQLESWESSGVDYLCGDKQYLAQKYYDPSELCIGLTMYSEQEEEMEENEREDFVRNVIHPLQAAMPVHLFHALAMERNNQSAVSMISNNCHHNIGTSIKPVLVQVEKPLFGVNAESRYLCFYSDNEAGDYAVIMGREFPVVTKHPYSWSMTAVCTFVQNRFEEREEIVESVRKRLRDYQNNPAILFTDTQIPEPEQKKQKSLVCPPNLYGTNI